GRSSARAAAAACGDASAACEPTKGTPRGARPTRPGRGIRQETFTSSSQDIRVSRVALTASGHARSGRDASAALQYPLPAPHWMSPLIVERHPWLTSPSRAACSVMPSTRTGTGWSLLRVPEGALEAPAHHELGRVAVCGGAAPDGGREA